MITEERIQKRNEKLNRIFTELFEADDKLRKGIKSFGIAIKASEETLKEFSKGNIRCATVELF